MAPHGTGDYLFKAEVAISGQKRYSDCHPTAPPKTLQSRWMPGGPCGQTGTAPCAPVVDRIDQLLLRVAAEKVRLASEGAALTQFGKLLQNCAFKFLETIEFLKCDGHLSHRAVKIN